VSCDAIAEIYGVRDFFGNYAAATTKRVRGDEEIWDEMRADMVREQRSRASAFWARQWRKAVLRASAVVLLLILFFL
jgi:hypothetical protein